MARTPRTHPILASDIWRSLVALGISTVVGFAVSVALGVAGALTGASLPTIQFASYFVFWSIFGIALIVLTVAVFVRAPHTELDRWLRETTPARVWWRRAGWAIVGGGAVPLAVTVSAVTIGGLLVIATSSTLRGAPVVIVSGIVVAAVSLASIIVGYAVRYAREDATRGGFRFPGEDPPTFASYFYLAVQVTTTYSSSDVELNRQNARVLVAVHSIIAFVFNTVIVALFVAVLLNAVTGA